MEELTVENKKNKELKKMEAIIELMKEGLTNVFLSDEILDIKLIPGRGEERGLNSVYLAVATQIAAEIKQQSSKYGLDVIDDQSDLNGASYEDDDRNKEVKNRISDGLRALSSFEKVMNEDDFGMVSGPVMELWYLVCWDVRKKMMSLRFAGIVLLGKSLQVKHVGSVSVDKKKLRIRSRRATNSPNDEFLREVLDWVDM